MDFDDTAAEAAFRAEARAWLEEHAQLRTGEEKTSLHRAAAPDHVERCRAWQRTLYDGGWAGITWPEEYGGRGGTPNEQRIFNEEQAHFDVWAGVFTVAIAMTGPTIIAHGTDEQRERFLDPMLRGDHVWCQLFSEPGAGSDLAGLSTRAVRDGSEFVVNGQKVWTSGAQHADWAILLARTDPDVPKHRGITYFLVDMQTPGIDVRPLRQIDGSAHFNEVFLTDVRIPADRVVGEVNAGWGPAHTTLANERTAIGGGGGTQFAHLKRLVDKLGGGEDRWIRQELAAAYSRWRVLEFLGYRVSTALSQGRMPGPESSVIKLAYSKHLEALGNLVMAIEGAHGMLGMDEAPLEGFAQSTFLMQWSARIGGGTDQVQRNVIGERVLGLPGEARPDKELPFKELARS